MKLVSVDTGGTFTDVLLFDSDRKTYSAQKYPSTPGNPSQAFLAGIDDIVRSGEEITSFDRIVHGTTVATNTVLTRVGAKTGLITTRGFRDVLEIGRGARPFADMFNQRWAKPKPLVERYLRLGVTERTNSKGELVAPLDEQEFLDAVAFLTGHGIEALAICFLFSFLNPQNERRAGELVARDFPGLPVSVSSKILPQWREYERTNTTVVDAYVKPIVAGYLGDLESGLKQRGYKGDVLLTKSNGGATRIANAAERPVETFLSGPAAAIVASQHIARQAGFTKVVSIDVGGTSFDMAILDENGTRLTTDGEIAPTLPIKVAMVDVTTIGAGGGSIAWRDAAGGLNVGPMSAGAHPGPVCFDRGGTEPTVTDANLALGRIDPSLFVSGRYPLRPDLAKASLQRLAGEFGLSMEVLAQGMLDVTSAAMAQEIRASASKIGADLRDFILFAGGGAGPLHAPMIARELGIGRVIAPLLPGMLSTVGLILSDLRFDSLKSFPTIVERADLSSVAAALRDMGTEGLARIERERLSVKIEIRYFLDVRYQRQHSEISLAVDPENLSALSIAAMFDAEHDRLFGFAMPDQRHEIINLRCSVSGSLGDPREVLSRFMPTFPDEEKPPVGTVKLYDEVIRDHIEAAVYVRSDLSKKQKIVGPSIIMSADSTIYIPTASTAVVDEFGNILIDIGVNGA